jgi:hypothetical protein
MRINQGLVEWLKWHLPNKREALNLNPGTAKRQKRLELYTYDMCILLYLECDDFNNEKY